MADLGVHSGCAKAVLIDSLGQRHVKATTGADAATAAVADQTFELAAGASVTIHYRQGVTGTPASTAPDAAEVVVLEGDSSGGGSGGTVVRTFAVTTPGVDQDFTFFATADGTSSGASRRGTFRLRVQASASGALAWRANSDNFNTLLATGQSNDWGKGYLRAGADMSAFGYSDVALGGAAPANNRFVYPKSQFLRVAGSVVPLTSSGTTRTTTVVQRQGAATKSTDSVSLDTLGNVDVTRTGGVGAASGINSAFTIADTGTDVRVTFGNSTLSSQPWTHWTSLPSGWTGTAGAKGTGFVQADSPSSLYLIDPRVTFTQLLQVNVATFATPPMNNNVASGQRLTSDLAFIAARATDAHGAGINGIAWTEKLWDSGQLTGSEASPTKSRASTGTTQGGQAGWSDALLTWNEALPGGAWTQKEVITSANASGLELSNTRTLTLVAVSPSIQVRVLMLGRTGSGKHAASGDTVRVAAYVEDAGTGIRVDPDASTTQVGLTRYTPSGTRVQSLVSATDNTSAAWADWAPAIELARFALTANANDARLFEKDFAATTGWGVGRVLAEVTCKVNGASYAGFALLEFTAARFPHDGTELESRIVFDTAAGHHHVGTDSRAIGDRS